jgi:site-specific recombinase XerD
MNGDLMDRFVADLTLKSYQKRSVQSYLRAVRQLQNFTCKAVEDITQEEVREYWLYCKEELGWGSATLRISYSGIKLFYSLTLKRDGEVLRSVKFERDQTLPVVLSIDEVRSILAAIPTLQNRAFFTVMYACGLRLGEAIHLQVRDIDGQRQFIHVRHGKGAKDRLVPLAESALSLLRAYYKTHRNPTWVFPALGKNGQGGPTAEQPVSETTVQGALRRAVVKTGLRKPVRPHTLRHSYATHMIEAGVPVRHVQECLGHESLASTMIYLHISSHGKEDSRRRMNQLMRGVLS